MFLNFFPKHFKFKFGKMNWVKDDENWMLEVENDRVDFEIVLPLFVSQVKLTYLFPSQDTYLFLGLTAGCSQDLNSEIRSSTIC